jgi:hypothetical protein
MDLLTMEITRITQVNLKLANYIALAWVEYFRDLVEPYTEWNDR